MTGLWSSPTLRLDWAGPWPWRLLSLAPAEKPSLCRVPSSSSPSASTRSHRGSLVSEMTAGRQLNRQASSDIGPELALGHLVPR